MSVFFGPNPGSPPRVLCAVGWSVGWVREANAFAPVGLRPTVRMLSQARVTLLVRSAGNTALTSLIGIAKLSPTFSPARETITVMTPITRQIWKWAAAAPGVDGRVGQQEFDSRIVQPSCLRTGMVTSTIHVLIITPVIFYLMRARALRRGTLKISGMAI